MCYIFGSVQVHVTDGSQSEDMQQEAIEVGKCYIPPCSSAEVSDPIAAQEAMDKFNIEKVSNVQEANRIMD